MAMQNFLIQSHRGAGLLAPENTIEAFELAWKLGTVPEADLRTTLDGVIVAFHDKDFSRVVRGAPPEMLGLGVQDVSFERLASLDVGAWHGESFAGRRVSAIEEVFELLRKDRERLLYLDIKNVALPQLALLASLADVAGQVILASPRHEQLREWRALAPASRTLLWMGGEEAVLKGRLDTLRQAGFEAISQLQIHVHARVENGVLELTPSAAFLRELGLELQARQIVFQALPWHSAEPEVYAALLGLGVQSFATDFPEVAVQAVRDYFAAPTGDGA